MLLSSLLISSAYAQDAAPSVAAASGNAFMQFVPFFLILAVFYFLLIRPQQKKFEAQENMIKALRKGDRIVTGGGIVATVFKVEGDDYLMIEIADGVRVKILRSTVSSLVSEPKAEGAVQDNNKK